MYAQAYVGARVAEFNVLWHVFVEPIGDDLPPRYTGRAYALKVKKHNASFNLSRAASCHGFSR